MSSTSRHHEGRRTARVKVLLAVVGCLGAGWVVNACSEDRTIAAFPESFSGVGMELETRGGRHFVVRAIDGSPAQAAGVQAGARLVAVDGETTEGMALARVVELVRGPRGTPVRLTFEQGGERRTLVVRRGKLTRTEASDRSGTAYQAGK